MGTRAWQILTIFQQDAKLIASTTEIGNRLGVTQPYVHHALKRLQAVGYLDRCGGNWSLTELGQEEGMNRLRTFLANWS